MKLDAPVVVGSGLSALGAALAFETADMKFNVIDFSAVPERSLDEISRQMSLKTPHEWNAHEWNSKLGVGSQVSYGLRKRFFGSEYFVSKKERTLPRFPGMGKHLPQSEALGGMAAGWGASALPLPEEEIADWKLRGVELERAYEHVLAQVPYSFESDSLSDVFSVFGKEEKPLTRTFVAENFFQRLLHGFAGRAGFRVGRSRLMVDTSPQGCRGCGACMSGCPYGAIFSPAQKVQDLARSSGGQFLGGIEVLDVEEQVGGVSLRVNRNGLEDVVEAPMLILATGPFPTLRILEASGFDTDGMSVKARSGFIFAALDFSSWKRTRAGENFMGKLNSLPVAFIEADLRKGRRAHVQVSFYNELLPGRPWLDYPGKGVGARVLGWFFRRFRIFFVNFGNQLASKYVCGPSSPTEVSRFRFEANRRVLPTSIKAFMALAGGLLKAKVLPIPFFIRNNGSYHVGATSRADETPAFGEFGEVEGFERVRVVDASVFPDLPGSTIGLTIIANSFRIVEAIVMPGKKNS